MIEFDGPPMAWFEAGGKRYTYESFAIGRNGSKTWPELVLMVASHIPEMSKKGAIVWRTRPDWDSEDAAPYNANWKMEAHPDCCKVYYRVVVIPWEDFAGIDFPPVKLEGEAVILLETP